MKFFVKNIKSKIKLITMQLLLEQELDFAKQTVEPKIAAKTPKEKDLHDLKMVY